MPDDVIFNLEGDSSSAVSALNNIQQAAETAKQAIDNIASAMQAFDDATSNISSIAASFDVIGEAATAASTFIDSISNSASGAASSLAPLVSLIGDVSTALDTVSSNASSAASALNDVKSSADATTLGVDALGNSSIDASSNVDKMAVAAAGATTSLDDVATRGDAAATQLAAVATSAADAIVEIDNLGTQAAAAASSLQDVSAYGDDAAAALDLLAGTTADTDAAMADLLAILKDVTLSMDQVASSANAAVAGLDRVGAAGQTAGAGAQAAAVGMEEARPAGENNGMMLMMLIPLLLQAGGGFAKMGMDAQDSIAHISGLADQTLASADASGKLRSILDQLEGSAMKYGVSLADASEGLYTIISNGYPAADAQNLLNLSMEAGAATGTDMMQVSTALTSILQAYGLKASAGTKITNEMITAVVQGNQTFDEFSKVVGRTAAVAASAGISFEDMLAAESAMTLKNPSVRQDTQNLSHLMTNLAADTDHYTAVAKEMGHKFDENKFKSDGLIEKLEYLAQLSGGAGSEGFRKMMRDTVSFNAAMLLLSGHVSGYDNILKQIDQSHDALDVAFKTSEATISASIRHITADMSVLSYKLVVIATPVVQAGLEAISKALQGIASNSQILLPILIGVSVAFGVLLIGAIGTLLGTISAFLVPTGAIAIVLGTLAVVVAKLAPEFMKWYESSSPLAAEMRVLQTVLMSVAGAIGGAFMNLLKAAQPLLHAIGDIIRTVILPALGNFAIGLGLTAADLGQKLLDALRNAAPMLQQFGVWVQTHVVPALQRMSPIINQVARTLGQFLPVILLVGGALVGLGPIAFNLIGGLSGIGGAISSVWGFFQLLARGVLGIGPAIRGIIPLFNTLRGILGGAFTTALNLVKTGFVNLSLAWQLAGNPLNFFITLARMAGGAISGLAGDLLALINPVTLIAGVIAIIVAGMISWFTQTEKGRQVLGVLWGAIQQLGATIMAALQPAIKQVQEEFKRLQPVFAQLVEAVKMAWPAIQFLGAVLGVVLVAAIGVVIGVLSGLITGLGNFVAGLIKAISGVIQFFAGLVQFLSGFLGLIVGLVHGNGTEIQKAWSMMGKGLQNMWTGLWTAIKGVLQAAVGFIVGFVSGFGKAIIGFFTNLYKVVVGNSIWPDMWKGIANTVVQFAARILSNIVSFFAGIIAQFIAKGAQILAQVLKIWQQMWNTINNYGKMIISIITVAWNTILAVIQNTLIKLWSLVLSTWSQIRAAIQVAEAAISALLRGDWQGFLNLITQAAQMIWMACMKFFTLALITISQSMNVIWLVIRTTWNAIWNIVSNIATTLWMAIEKMWLLIVAFFDDGTKAAIDFVTKFVGDMQKKFDDFVKAGQKWGKDFIDGLVKAIKDGASNVTDAVHNIAQAIANLFGHSTPVEGPMHGDDEWMIHFMQNLQQGIEKNRHLVRQAALGVASDISVAVPTTANVAASVNMPQDSSSSEHIEVLKQILAAIQSQGQGGRIGSQIGYNIPSTQLGSVNQQFNNTTNFSINDVANMYSQINQLAGLSNEYAGRGAITGVGF